VVGCDPDSLPAPGCEAAGLDTATGRAEGFDTTARDDVLAVLPVAAAFVAAGWAPAAGFEGWAGFALGADPAPAAGFEGWAVPGPWAGLDVAWEDAPGFADAGGVPAGFFWAGRLWPEGVPRPRRFCGDKA